MTQHTRPRLSTPRLLALVLAAAAGACCSVANAAAPPLLRDLPGVTDPAMETDASIIRSRPVTLDLSVLPAPDAAAGTRLDLPLFDDFGVTILFTGAETTDRGSTIYTGRVLPPAGRAGAAGGGWATLVRSGDALAADVQLGLGGLFNIRALPIIEGQPDLAGGHAVRQIDLSVLPPCATGPEHEVHAPAEPVLRGPTDDGTVMDVLVVYTPAARSGAGGRASMEAAVDLAISLANQAYTNSGVNTRLNLVYTGVIDYEETGNASTELSRLRSTTDGHMDAVHCLRDSYGADFVALIVNSFNACGIGYLMTNLSTGFASSAFSVTQRSCISGHTFTHEIGHNLGCAHDRDNAGNAVFPYAYGYRSTDNAYRTIMAYSPGTRIPYFSSPDTVYQGRVMGIPAGQPDAAHNALSVSNVRTTAALFRTSLGPFNRAERLSISSSGVQGNGASGLEGLAVSANGRFVAFSSLADNLVAEDTNGGADVFVHDRQSGLTTRESVASGSTVVPGGGSQPGISDNGRYVVFASAAQDLVSGSNPHAQIYLRDRNTSTTTRLSRTPGNAPGNGPSASPVIAANASVAVFQSDASDLVAGDSNGASDIFARILPSGSLSRISVAPGGQNAGGASRNPAVSADGRYVAYESDAPNLVANDTNGVSDIFLHDRQAGTTVRVSVATGGAQADGPSRAPRISPDGRLIAFTSDATNLVPGDTNNASDVFVHDRIAGTTRRVSLTAVSGQVLGPSTLQGLSGDGRLVFFTSPAVNVVPPDSDQHADLFVRDTVLRQTRRLSRNHRFQYYVRSTDAAAATPSGRYVALATTAANALPCDANGTAADVILLDLGDPPPAGCSADINGDGTINSTDLSAFISLWLDSVSASTLAADFNDDNVVNSTDLSAFISAWLAQVAGGC